MDIPGMDPSILNRPMSELPQLDQKTNEGITIGADAQSGQQAEGAGEAPQTPAGESKVPYTRFKKFHDRALEAEREAEFWKNRAMEIPPQQQHQTYQPQNQTPNFSPQQYDGQLPGYWVELYGDSDAARRAYSVELQRQDFVSQQAFTQALAAVDQRSQQQEQQYAANREALDEGLEEAADIMGRDLTSDEELAILDIQDDYSPKDRDGRIQALLPIEKAVEIYEMQSSRAQSPRRQARNAIAAVSSSSSGGDTTVASAPGEQNSKFVPQLGWRANLQRLTGKNPNNVQ